VPSDFERARLVLRGGEAVLIVERDFDKRAVEDARVERAKAEQASAA